jgi:lipid II:glycine glycyltransferase (peptidoglycan interpeptide bridge formation enzyme)
MTLISLDPLTDPRWDDFVQRHPRASVFHTTGWLRALRQTYGYEPVVFTTSPPGKELKNGIVLCRIQSWITGRRMVSLPFSDHCEPLVESAAELQQIMEPLLANSKTHVGRFLELRPRTSSFLAETPFGETESFAFHVLDLNPDLAQIHRSFDKDSVQRRIRRAEREPLQYEEGRSEALLQAFYQLQMVTRRRHQIPPQPLDWFRNLSECMGEGLKVRVVSKDGEPIASILTLHFRGTLVYKYGCSNSKFNNLGGTVFLLWKAIQDAKELGVTEFDLGKSEWNNPGLIAFKDNWGTQRSVLAYARYPARPHRASHGAHGSRLAGLFFSSVPDAMLAATGRALYRHIG